MYSVIEKGDNLVKLVSLDEERRWLYCLLYCLPCIQLIIGSFDI